MYKRLFSLSISIGFIGICFTQNLHKINVEIDTITVVKKKENSNLLERIDLIPKKANFQSSSLANLVSKNSNFYIKNYGQGQLASISFQGLGAQHTNINWNGVKLNSPMLGQTDLNVLQIGNADKIVFNQQNADNLGGALNLKKDFKYLSKNELSMASSVGSFVSSSGNLSYLFSNSKLFTQSLISYQSAKNNFSYKNPSLPGNTLSRQVNAETKLLNLEQTLGLKLNSTHQLKLFLKYFKANRNIAPSLFETNASERQKDNLFLTKIAWHQIYKKLEATLSSSFVFQDLVYQFSLLSSLSINKSNSWQSQFKFKYRLEKGLNLHFNIFNNFETAISNNYANPQNRNNLNLTSFLNYKNKSFESNLGFNQFLIDGDLKAFLPHLSLGFLKHIHTTKIRIQGNYQAKLRVPTFNELYWDPGGNPELDDENSQNISVQVSLTKKLKRSILVNNLEFFSSLIQNYIQWLPSPNIYWQPINIGTIVSRGFHNTTQFDVSLSEKLALQMNGSYTYTKISNQKSDNQLIYVPKSRLQIETTLKAKAIHLGLNHQFTSGRYTDVHNTNKLNSFYLLDLYAGRNFNLKNSDRIEIAAHIYNLSNTSYFTVLNRPLPGIHFEFSFKYKLHFKP